MAITPTSTKSKQYQALGIDEMANDIETVFTTVNNLETTVGNLETEVNNLPAAPTTTVVNISSAQILAMGTTPIELLPASGAGKYYDIEKIILEYTHVTTPYVATSNLEIPCGGNIYSGVDGALLGYSDNTVVIVDTNNGGIDEVNNNTVGLMYTMNQPTLLKTVDSNDPTDGDGTLRAIITYTLRTFGA